MDDVAVPLISVFLAKQLNKQTNSLQFNSRLGGCEV